VIKFWKEWSGIRGGKLIAAGIILGCVLLLFGPRMTERNKEGQTEENSEYLSVQFYTEHMEKRIENLCCQIRGIGEAHVLLTLDGSAEYIYAENTASSAGEYVILHGSDEENPLLVQEIYPKIRGVAVVCTRGDDSAVRLAVTELLSAALGIPASCIRVVGA